jgi:predicted dehydrogenase
MAKQGQLRVGLIGAGGIARTHARDYQKCEDVTVVAASDPSEEALARMQSEHKVEQTFTDYKEMLKKCELDAVSVCTPNFLHMQPTIDALKAGCHVLVEKPMAMNATECKRMIAAADKAGKHLQIAFQHRFEGKVQLIRKAFEAGFFGKIQFVRVQALRRRGIPNWGVFGHKDKQGGGPLIDIGVHCLEMAHYAAGSPTPVAASGMTWTFLGNKPSEVVSQWPNWDYKTYTVEDLAVGHIRMADGCVFHIEASFATHIPHNGYYFQIIGEKGGCTYEPFAFFHDHAGMMLDATPSFVPKVEIFPHKMKHFVNVCLGKEDSKAPAVDGLNVQKMLDGIYQSAEKGKEVIIGN